MEDILHNIGDFFGIFMDARGRDDGLALLWEKNVTVDLLSCSLHHIDVSISVDGVDSRGVSQVYMVGLRPNKNGRQGSLFRT